MQSIASADFTSALYLGLRHSSSALPAWSALTTGRPAVLGRPAGADEVATELASLVGTERATLARSTLHALDDCLDVLAGPRSGIVADAGVYDIGRSAVHRASGAGVPVIWVAHHDLDATADAVRRFRRGDRRPVVVADALCTGCGEQYPLVTVRALVAGSGGTLLLDDTQALGVLGHSPSGSSPYGRGGGGSIRHTGTSPDAVVTASSLAKAFGVPVACIAGSADFVRKVRVTGSAVHSSPPSAADVAAATHALACNSAMGDDLRSRLANRVRGLRRQAAHDGLLLIGGLFPVQTTPTVGQTAGRWLVARLASGGVRAVLRQACGRGGSAVTLTVTAAHRPSEIERAARVLGRAWLDLDRMVSRA